MSGHARPGAADATASWWLMANVLGLAIGVVWAALSVHRADGFPSGALAGFAGVVLLSMAGQSIHSKTLFLRYAREPVTPATHPVAFWTVSTLQIVAGIRCFFLI